MKKRTVKLLLLHLLAALCLAALAGYGCPSYRLLRLRCPGCGLTRAWLLFLGGHLAEAFRMHALFLPAPFCILLLADVLPRMLVSYFRLCRKLNEMTTNPEDENHE